MTLKHFLLAAGVVILTPAFAWHHCPPPYHWHGGCYHHHHGCHAGDFWAGAGVGLASGLIGAAVYNAVRPAPPTVVVQPQPIVVQQPVVVQSQPVVVQQPVVVPAQPTVVQQVAPQAATTVWVEGRYIDQVQPNGSVTRVWNPGHYEMR